MSVARPENSPPPPPAKTGGFNYSELIFRVVIILALSFSVWLGWWSYNRVYLPQLKEAREANATLNQLSTEVDDLDRRWPPADIEKLNQRLQLVDSNLFSDQSALEAWLADLREQSPPLGWDLKATFEKSRMHSAAQRNVYVIPTSLFIELHTVTNAPAMLSPYQRLLQLARQIALQQKRGDFTELTVDTGSNSISRAVMGLNFWTGGKEAQ
jgi:cell division protein FtsB